MYSRYKINIFHRNVDEKGNDSWLNPLKRNPLEVDNQIHLPNELLSQHK